MAPPPVKCVFAVDGWTGRPAGDWHRCAIVVPVDDRRPSAVLVWADAAPDARDLFGVDAPRWIVEERPQWGAELVPGVTRLVWVRRRASMSRDEFAAHWTDHHAPLARVHHPAMRRYTQNIVLEGPPGDDVDGIAELGFDRAEDLRERMYDSDDGRRVISEDVDRFLDLTAGWRVEGIERRLSNGIS